MSIVSPAPPLPKPDARKNGTASSSPKRWAGLKEISPARVRRIHALYGIVLLRRSLMPAKISDPTNSRPLIICGMDQPS